MFGGYCEGGTPDPFSNSEVKPFCADDTASLRCGKVGRRQVFFCLFEFVACLPTVGELKEYDYIRRINAACGIPDPRPIMHRIAVWIE